MPHIIIEYSRNMGDIIEIPDLVLSMHQKLADAGIDKSRIKTRAVVCNQLAVGNHDLHGHMLHATLLLLVGRDVETRKAYGDVLHETMKSFVDGVVKHCAVTLEIREMNPDTYYM